MKKGVTIEEQAEEQAKLAQSKLSKGVKHEASVEIIRWMIKRNANVVGEEDMERILTQKLERSHAQLLKKPFLSMRIQDTSRDVV